MQQLRNYIYLDKAGIDSLVSQITAESIEENHLTTTCRKSGGAKGNMTFPNLLKKLFNVDVDLTGEVEIIEVTEKITTQPYETKLQQIIKYVKKSGNIISDSITLPHTFLGDKQNFIYSSIIFDTNCYSQNWPTYFNTIEKFGYIQFFCGGNDEEDTYEYQDSYYKILALNKIKLVMNMNIKKMPSWGGTSSHFATLLQATGGKHIQLGVFGHIFRITESVYQIKPYAVWRV